MFYHYIPNSNGDLSMLEGQPDLRQYKEFMMRAGKRAFATCSTLDELYGLVRLENFETAHDPFTTKAPGVFSKGVEDEVTLLSQLENQDHAARVVQALVDETTTRVSKYIETVEARLAELHRLRADCLHLKHLLGENIVGGKLATVLTRSLVNDVAFEAPNYPPANVPYCDNLPAAPVIDYGMAPEQVIDLAYAQECGFADPNPIPLYEKQDDGESEPRIYLEMSNLYSV